MSDELGAHLLAIAQAGAAQSESAPVFFERCPVHGQLVGFDGEFRLLGRCDTCMGEAARAVPLVFRPRPRGATAYRCPSL